MCRRSARRIRGLSSCSSAVERDPVFVDPQAPAAGNSRCASARATCRAPTRSEAGMREISSCVSNPNTLSSASSLFVSPTWPRYMSAATSRRRNAPDGRKAHLPARAPRFAVAAIGAAVALEVVVRDVELVADAELRRADRLGRRPLHRHADQFRRKQLAEVDRKRGRQRQVRIVVLPPVLRRQLLADADAREGGCGCIPSTRSRRPPALRR